MAEPIPGKPIIEKGTRHVPPSRTPRRFQGAHSPIASQRLEPASKAPSEQGLWSTPILETSQTPDQSLLAEQSMTPNIAPPVFGVDKNDSGMDIIWGTSQPTALLPEAGKKPKFKQVTNADIINDPDKNGGNPIRNVDGETLRNIWLRNMGYQPGSFEMIPVPIGGSIKFLFKPSYDREHRVDNWPIQGFNEAGASLGTGTISTWLGKGSRITTKEGQKLTVFRPTHIVRR